MGGKEARTRGGKNARERLAREASTRKSACVRATRAGLGGGRALASSEKVPQRYACTTDPAGNDAHPADDGFLNGAARISRDPDEFRASVLGKCLT